MTESRENMAMFLMNEIMPKSATPQVRKEIKADFLALGDEALTEIFNFALTRGKK
jgi:hypothetical protein